jgi:O-antigen ligase
VKWAFLLVIIGLVPVLTQWLRQNPGQAPKVWMLIGFLPFMQGPWDLYIAPISWALWPGYVKGLEVSILDSVTLAVLLSSPRPKGKLALKYPFLAYILACLFAASQANVPMASLFYVWQLGRIFLIYLAVAAICGDRRAPIAILSGMGIGLIIQAGFSISERLGGDIQAGGTFGHQNLLGMVSHFAIFPIFAWLLAGARSWLAKLGPPAGLLIAILGASRATIGFAGGGYVALLLLSAIRKWTPRKGAVIMWACVIAAIATPIANSALQQRFAANPLPEGYDERAAFERAAQMISDDHPLGIGANQYVVIANLEGYSDRAGVIWNWGSRQAHVHNTYMLALAETGYAGLAALVLLLGSAIATALRAAWRSKDELDGELLLGFGVTLIVVAAHSLYEWVFVTFHVQYMFGICLGMIAGLTRKATMPQAGPKPEVRRKRPGAAPLLPSLSGKQQGR